MAACSSIKIENQEDLCDDLESVPFLNSALQRFTIDIYYRFGALLAPVSVGLITGRHYVKNISHNKNGTENRTTDSSDIERPQEV